MSGYDGTRTGSEPGTEYRGPLLSDTPSNHRFGIDALHRGLGADIHFIVEAPTREAAKSLALHIYDGKLNITNTVGNTNIEAWLERIDRLETDHPRLVVPDGYEDDR